MTSPIPARARATRRFADQQTARLAAIPGVRAVIGTVVSVAGSSVLVSWRGVTVTAAGSLASYTPAAGDRVLCLLVDSQLVVIDQIVT